MGLNFETLRPREEILADYKRVLERIYDPATFAGRLQRLAKMLDNSSRKQRMRAEFSRQRFGNLEVLHQIMNNLPEPRDGFRRALTECMSSNPDSIRYIVLMMAFYLHVGPFSRDVITRIDNMIATLEAGCHRVAQPSSAQAQISM
jgi:hypothetical protein